MGPFFYKQEELIERLRDLYMNHGCISGMAGKTGRFVFLWFFFVLKLQGFGLIARVFAWVAGAFLQKLPQGSSKVGLVL